MRILWQMPTLRRTGCGLSIRARRLATALEAAGHGVTFQVDAGCTDIDADTIEGMAIRKVSLRRGRPLHWSLQAITRRRAARTHARCCDEHHDMLLSCQPEFVAASAALDHARPIVFICGGTTLLHDAAERADRRRASHRTRLAFAIDRRLKRRNERAAFRRADAVVFDSESTRQLIVGQYGIDPGKCHAICGGVDPDEFLPPTPSQRNQARSRLGLSANEFVALWTGRIAPEKNLGLLIDGLALDRNAADRLILVGDGPDRHGLERRVHAAGLDALVTFTGMQDDVRPFLNAADAFVFPSRGESFGGSLTEAMACGLPCLALRPDGHTIVTASPEILDNGTGGVIIDNSPAAVAQSLRDLRRDPDLRSRLGQAARRRVVEYFNWRSAGRQLAGLLARVARSIASHGSAEPMLSPEPRPVGMSEI